jgi:hypothetical protein
VLASPTNSPSLNPTSIPSNNPTTQYLPVIVQPITNYTNGPRLSCPTPCPVITIYGEPYYTPDVINTSFVNFPNATTPYPDNTYPLTYKTLFLVNDVICLGQPTWDIYFGNLTGLPCSDIIVSKSQSTVFDNINNVATVTGIYVTGSGSFTNMPKLQEITVTASYGSSVGFGNLPVLRKINLIGLSNNTIVIAIINCSSLPYATFPLYNFPVISTNNGNLMGITLNGLSGLDMSDNAAFERLDIINRTAILNATYDINTRSERFLNSRPNCFGTVNNTYLIDECLPVNGAPGRNETECNVPIAHKCLTNLYYNESCWLTEWIVPTFNLTTNAKDCSFDSNHWFNVTTLYVLNGDIIIPARIKANNTIYINSVSPSKNPSKNPTQPSKSPSNNPTNNPTNPSSSPTNNPSRNPTTGSPTNNPTNPTTSPTNNPSRNPTNNPSRNPSRNPSKNPTKVPTNKPSKNPTTNAPTTIEFCNVYGGAAVRSLFGIRCSICNYNGYVLNGVCVCYSKLLNPFQSCEFISPEPLGRRLSTTRRSSRQLSTVSTSITKTSVKCICPFDNVNGYYKQNNIQHQFGKPNPPICDQCVVESLGPKPLENPGGSFTKACTIYGSFDPNYANTTTSWRACSNHGFWGGSSCNCNKGWRLGNDLETFNSSIIIKSCNVCDYNYGPLVQANALGAPYCNKVFTPDDHGVPKECGGKGVYLYGRCECYHGYILSVFENVNTCL